jgi:hypothetical protein
MERVMAVNIKETLLAPPMWPITIQTAKPSFDLATSTADEVGWGPFEIEKFM